MKLSPLLESTIAESRARVRVGYAWWLRPWLPRNVVAVTLGRTIHLSAAAAERSGERLEVVIRHELAHVRQVNQYGALVFLVRYTAEFCRHLWRERNADRAYRMISFEIEARQAEGEAERTVL
jgi:hypothetical protein